MSKTSLTLALSMVAMSTLAVASTSTPPKSTAAISKRAMDAALGHKVFLTNCSPCHGANAQGDDGPNLHHANLSADTVTSTVTNGIKDEMPPFGKKLKPKELTVVVTYVRSLQ